MVGRAKRADLPRQFLGKFLRLAEFGADASYDELYERIGGALKERQAFLTYLVDNRYILIRADGGLELTGHGRRISRLLIRGVPLV